MPLDPNALKARREAARHRRRRLRLQRLGIGGSLIAAAALAAYLLTGVGSGGHASGRPGSSMPVGAHTAPAPHRASGLPDPQAQSAAVRRFLGMNHPIFCGGRHGRYVALTFDDGPGVYTHLALPLLRRAQQRATFFLVGRNLRTRWRNFPRKELGVGTLGDHTYTHSYLPGLSPQEVQSQLAQTQSGIDSLTGLRTGLFRPPYGATNTTIEAQAKALGMIEVRWSVDSRDSEGADSQSIASTVKRGLLPGSIILMHENHGQTIVALWRSILPALRKRHLQSVTVPELLALDPPSARQVRRGPRGCRLVPGLSTSGG